MIDLRTLRSAPDAIRHSQELRGEDPSLVDVALSPDEVRWRIANVVLRHVGTPRDFTAEWGHSPAWTNCTATCGSARATPTSHAARAWVKALREGGVT